MSLIGRNPPTSTLPTQLQQENPTEEPKTGPIADKPTLVSPLDGRNRHSRVESDHESVFSQIFNTKRESHQLNRFIKLADLDQFALVLAGLLCISILIFAITIVCICFQSTRADEPETSNVTNPHSRRSKRRDRLVKRSICCVPFVYLSNMIMSLIGCIFCCRPSTSSSHKVMRSLILLDDDNSSGSSGGGAQMPLGKSGRDKLGPIIMMNSGANSGARSRSLLSSNQKNQIRRSNTLSRINSGYLFSSSSASTNSTTTGRRRSMANLATVGIQRDSQQLDGDWNDPDKCDALSVSCDSDKSCSPGANRNNRYDIGNAHRAYMNSNSNAYQIQTSMYLNTQQQPGTANRTGLLKTIEDVAEENHKSPKTCIDYLRPINEHSSGVIDQDKLNCDDSRAKAMSGCDYHSSTMNNEQSKSKGGLGISYCHSIARAQDLGSFTHNKSNDSCKNAGIRNARFVGHDICLLGDEMLPVSAEDDCQWPEPYVEPLNEVDEITGDQNKCQSSEKAPSDDIQALNKSTRGHDGSSNDQMRYGHQQYHNRHHLYHATNRKQNFVRNEAGRTHPNGDVYMANWFNIGHATRNQNQQHVDFNETWDIERQSNHKQDFSTTLTKCKSIPSLASHGFRDERSYSPTLPSNGASNWLRWSSKEQNDMLRRNSNLTKSRGRLAKSVDRKNWDSENQIDSIYVEGERRIER